MLCERERENTLLLLFFYSSSYLRLRRSFLALSVGARRIVSDRTTTRIEKERWGDESRILLDRGRSTLMRIYCLSNNKPERLKE